MKRGSIFPFPRALERHLASIILASFDWNENSFDNAMEQALAGIPIDMIDDFNTMYDDIEPDFETKDFLGIYAGITSWVEFNNKNRPTLYKTINKENELQSLLEQFSTIIVGMIPVIKQRAQEATKAIIKEAIGHTSFSPEKMKEWAKQKLEDKLYQQSQTDATSITEGYTGAIMLNTAKSLQFDFYEWVTMSDDRVRHSHELMNGLTCLWQDPTLISENGIITSRNPEAVQMHPGEDYNCRCTAFPIIMDSTDN